MVVGRHQRIYSERFSLTPESEVGLEESAAGGTQCRCLRVSVAQIVYRLAPGSTSPSVAPCAVATKGQQQMPVVVVGEGGSPGTVEACPTFQVMWSAPWEVGGALKVSVCSLQPRKEGQIGGIDVKI